MFEQLEETKKEQQKLAHQIRSKLEPKLIEHEKKNSEHEARSEQTRREMTELIDKLRKANKKVAKHKELSNNHEEVSIRMSYFNMSAFYRHSINQFYLE